MVWAARHIRDDFGLMGIWNRRLQYADDRSGAVASNAAKVNGFANNGRIAIERVRPETVGEHNNAGRLRAVIFRSNESPEYRTQAHHFEIGSVDHASD